MKKTEKVYDVENNLIGEFDYMDFLQFKLNLLSTGTGMHDKEYYIEDEDGLKHLIDEFGCVSTYNPFREIDVMLTNIIHLQMTKRKKYFEERNKGRS